MQAWGGALHAGEHLSHVRTGSIGSHAAAISAGWAKPDSGVPVEQIRLIFVLSDKFTAPFMTLDVAQ